MNAQEFFARLVPLTASHAALKRAAMLARDTAITTHTRLIIMQDSKIVVIHADKLAAQKQSGQDQ